MKTQNPHRKLKANLSRAYDDLDAALFFMRTGQTQFARNYINGVKSDIKNQLRNL